MFTGRPYNTTKLPLVVLLLSNKTHAYFHFNTQFFIQSFYSFTTYVIFFQALLTCVMWEKELLCNKGILKHVYKIHFFNKQQKSTFKVYTYYLDKARPTYTPLKHDAEKLISLWLLNVSSQCFWYADNWGTIDTLLEQFTNNENKFNKDLGSHLQTTSLLNAIHLTYKFRVLLLKYHHFLKHNQKIKLKSVQANQFHCLYFNPKLTHTLLSQPLYISY